MRDILLDEKAQERISKNLLQIFPKTCKIIISGLSDLTERPDKKKQVRKALHD